MQRILSVIAVIFVGLIFASISVGYSAQVSLRPLAESYIRLVPQELGTPNVITGILLSFRAFDTLGEVAVLFMVAAGVGLLLEAGGKEREQLQALESLRIKPSTEIVQNGADILVPQIAIFAAYIVMH